MAVTPISTPPLLIDVAVQYFTTFNCFVGPWEANGALYCVLSSISIGAVIHVFKSTDNGTTWIAQDDGNTTEFTVVGQQSTFSPTEIVLFYTGDLGTTQESHAYPFDIASDTYGTLATAAETPGVALSSAFAVLRSDNSIFYFTTQSQFVNPASGLGVLGRIFSAGSFSARFVVDSEAGGGGQTVVPLGMALDANDVSHIVTQYFNPTLVNTRYLTMDSSNVILGPEIILDPGNTSQFAQPLAYDTDKLAFPYIDLDVSPARVKMMYATGATVTPTDATWSIIDVWTTGLGATSVDRDPFAILDGADLLIFWVNTEAGISRIYYARFNGVSLAAPVLYYDSSLFPPAGSTQDPVMRATSIAIVGGAFVGITAMDIDGNGDQSYYLFNAGGATGYYHSMY